MRYSISPSPPPQNPTFPLRSPPLSTVSFWVVWGVIEWKTNTGVLLLRHRADADYYPRLYSMILDQIEYVAADGHGGEEMFYLEHGKMQSIVHLDMAKEFIIGQWSKFLAEGKSRLFKVVPVRY
jgi:hypothetical protein